MVDLNTVCCMCGDVGFPEKLFRCARCFSRFQHSYCSNYYEDSTEAAGFCDWCRSEERKSSRKLKRVQSKKTSAGEDQDDYPRDEKSKPEANSRGRSSSGAGPSTRPSGRRYKLLKDVLC